MLVMTWMLGPLAGAGRALLTSDVVKWRGVRNRARDGACCDDTCCDARGVMHEYIMAIFLGKSENQEGGGMLIVKVGGNLPLCLADAQ